MKINLLRFNLSSLIFLLSTARKTSRHYTENKDGETTGILTFEMYTIENFIFQKNYSDSFIHVYNEKNQLIFPFHPLTHS